MKTNKLITAAISILLLLQSVCLFACSEDLEKSSPSASDSATENVQKNDMLYGICYPYSEREGEGFLQKDIVLMDNLGVGCVRNWMHITDLLQSKSKINAAACEKMHGILALQKEKNMTIIGMSHTNFNGGGALSGKPERNIEKGSEYLTWLFNYYTSWKTLAREFPEVEYWEIENEINNADFMKNTQGEAVYSLKEMADISTDMLYYASRAIHSVNPKAKTVLGGITEPRGLGNGENTAFLELLYQNIKSGEFGYFYGLEDRATASADPDDYFEIACWHPYVWTEFDKSFFINENKKIYDVILKYEPNGKDVFFTEIGFSNENKTEETTSRYLTLMFEAVKESMPYVKTVNYFKMFDVAKKTWTGRFSRYGLFYDSGNNVYAQAVGDTVTPLKNGAPKLTAYTFQQLAGGKGTLELYNRKS